MFVTETCIFFNFSYFRRNELKTGNQLSFLSIIPDDRIASFQISQKHHCNPYRGATISITRKGAFTYEVTHVSEILGSPYPLSRAFPILIRVSHVEPPCPLKRDIMPLSKIRSQTYNFLRFCLFIEEAL